MNDSPSEFVKGFAAFFAKSVTAEIEQADRQAKSKWKQINCKADEAGRSRAFAQLLVNIIDGQRDWAVSASRNRTELVQDLGGPNLGYVGIGLEGAPLDEYLCAVGSAFSNHQFDLVPAALQLFVSYQFMAARLSPHHPLFRYQSDVGQSCTKNHFAHCLLIARGSWPHARWLGRYLMNFHRNECTRFTDEEFNPAIHLMLRTLAHITEADAWPTLSELPAEMGPYHALFETVGNPSAFAEALMRVLDFRMARYNGYQDVGVGTRKARWAGILGYESWAVLPAELLAFQALAERYLGVRPSLDVPHPWINNPLTQQLGPIDIHWQDDTLREVRQLAAQTYGAAWDSMELLPVAPVASPG